MKMHPLSHLSAFFNYFLTEELKNLRSAKAISMPYTGAAVSPATLFITLLCVT